MKMIRAALFDMDGTLVANSPVHIRAFEIFCDRYGVRDWRQKLRNAFGRGNDDIMRLILPEELIARKGLAALADEKEAIYREIYAPEIRPVEGLRELLRKLRTAGALQAARPTSTSCWTSAASASSSTRPSTATWSRTANPTRKSTSEPPPH